MPNERDTILPASLVVALLVALPAAAQTAPPADSGASKPTVTDGGAGAPAATPALESPALGPLGGRDTPPPVRPLEGGTLLGFTTSAPSFGVGGLDAPLDLGPRPYAIRPSIGVGVLATDNLFQSSSDRQSDIVTTISPSLEAAISTTRLSGSLRYTPALRLYANHSDQNGIDHIGDGRLLAALVPGLFYVDARGAASVLPVLSGQLPGSGQALPGGETLQTFTGQVTPFLVHRFGSAASLQTGYSFQYSQQNSANFGQSGSDNLTQENLAQGYMAHSGFAVLRSGEDLGRLALQARFGGTWYVGSGIYDDAHRLVTALEARYAILRSIAVLGEIGYENQAYAGTSPLSIEDAIWSFGLRLTPSPDSIIIVRYGHRDGVNSLNVNAGVALGVRTDLFAIYRESLATSLTQGQDLLANTTTDALGNPVDSQSGAPVALINPFLGLSDTLFRMRMGTVAVRHHWSRDAFTLSGTWQSQDPVTSASNTEPVSSSSGIYATLNWAHDFSPNTTGMATMQYGHVTGGQTGSGNASFGQAGSGDSDTYALAATLSHQLSEKLTASMQVAWIGNTSPQAGQGYTQGTIRVGLRRTF